MPFLTAGSVLAAVGAGLMYTMGTTLSPPQFIGYQALLGTGIGTALNVPTIVNQAMAKPTDVSSVTASILCESGLQSFLVTSNLPLSLSNHGWSSLCCGSPEPIQQPLNLVIV